MPRNTSGLNRGGPGRKPGIPNKATVEVKEAAQAFLNDPAGLAKMLEQYRRGKLAPPVVIMLHHYAYGKPKDIIQHENPDGSAINGLPPIVFYLPQNARDSLLTT